MVGIYSLIDEVCKVDLRRVSYVEEFSKLIENNLNKICNKEG